jgi:hypothetical protein
MKRRWHGGCGHAKGLSPEWMRRWALRLKRRPMFFPQPTYGHIYVGSTRGSAFVAAASSTAYAYASSSDEPAGKVRGAGFGGMSGIRFGQDRASADVGRNEEECLDVARPTVTTVALLDTWWSRAAKRCDFSQRKALQQALSEAGPPNPSFRHDNAEGRWVVARRRERYEWCQASGGGSFFSPKQTLCPISCIGARAATHDTSTYRLCSKFRGGRRKTHRGWQKTRSVNCNPTS